MELERSTVPLSDLKAAPYNPRRISKTALAGLQKSIERFGLVQEIVVNKRSGHIVGGHQRVQALKVTGAKDAPVVYVDLSEAEERALNVTLNNPLIGGEYTDDLQAVIDAAKVDLPAADVEALRLDELLPDMPDMPDMTNVTGHDRALPDASPQLGGIEYRVVVDCRDEAHQAALLARFEVEGLPCRALMS